MKSMIKYRGGKTKEIPKFEKYIPNNFDTYYEPFFGGGAVFFYLQPKKAVISDINEKLINFYLEMQQEYNAARKELNYLQTLYENNQQIYNELKIRYPDKHIKNENEILYYKIRDIFNGKIKSDFMSSVIYFFINKTAYSGMIRYNANGEYNVPFGRYQNFNTNLITQEHSELLKKAHIFKGDYSIAFDMATKNDFMFLDPPYDCIFNDYGNIEFKNGFGEKEHRRLATAFKELKCKAMMIIGKTPLTEELYDDYIKDEYFKSYTVNIRNRFKAAAKHIIVTNY